uniref:Uncharacterized protein n=1 Tax=uncultured myxobacterium HF0200_19H16 TaxID=723559 RepID=E7C3V0_9BACT|nr:hypothetical protein [uncultured myxobacterium HF0200_19H16]
MGWENGMRERESMAGGNTQTYPPPAYGQSKALVPQILNHRMFRRPISKLNELRNLSRLGSGLWLLGTLVGVLGGHIVVEAGITTLGLASIALGIFRAS